MIDVKKLRNSIDELESHSASLARVVSLYNKLESFRAELDTLRLNISDSCEKLKAAEALYTDALESLKLHLKKIPSETLALRKEIGRWNADTRQDISNGIEVLRTDQTKMVENFINEIHPLLSRHKSDIEVALRNEGAQIQRGLENVVQEKHLMLQTILNSSLSDISNKIFKQQKYFFVAFALTTANLIIFLAGCIWLLIK